MKRIMILTHRQRDQLDRIGNEVFSTWSADIIREPPDAKIRNLVYIMIRARACAAHESRDAHH